MRMVSLCHSSGLSLAFRGPLHTRACGPTLSKQERAWGCFFLGFFEEFMPFFGNPGDELPSCVIDLVEHILVGAEHGGGH